jgi:hypothetical protein
MYVSASASRRVAPRIIAHGLANKIKVTREHKEFVELPAKKHGKTERSEEKS